MTENEKPKTPASGFEAIDHPLHEPMEKEGITPEYLAKKLKAELEAEETKTFKVKGSVDKGALPQGFEIISDTGNTHESTRGNIYIDGETILQFNEITWRIRQEARKDAHKLRGDYPAEKHDISGALQVIPKLGEADRELLTNTANKVVDAILNEHRRDIKSGS